MRFCLGCGAPHDDPDRLFCGHCPDVEPYDQVRDHMDDMAMYDEAETFYPEPEDTQ